MLKWTKEELDLLSSLNGNKIEKDLFQEYFPKRTVDKIRRKAKSLGLSIGVKRHHHNEWSKQEDQCILDYYNIDINKLKILLPNRSWKNIRQRALNIHGLDLKKRWSKKDIVFLKNNYYNCDKEILLDNLNRSWNSIKLAAANLGLKRSHDFTRQSNLLILLDESLESLYWIGFILADGHIGYNQRLQITLANEDKQHLAKFAKYISCENIYYDTTVHIAAQNKEVIPKICETFDINSNKTYEPPNFNNYKLTDDQFLSLFAGFFDGDGNVTQLINRKQQNMRIKVHSSWLHNLLYMENRLYKIFPYTKKYPQFSKINNQGYASLGLSNHGMIKDIRTKIETLNLPLLRRKWDKIG